MTFLNPFLLFGLAAAAIPVLLHLLNLRKLRTIEFSTLRFLKELQQTRIRQLKLRQLLLLLIRTLLVILIILAFARPALKGSLFGAIGTDAHTTVVVILDDSFSMMSSDEHGEVFKQAKDAAGRIIGMMKAGDEAFLVKLSDVPRATIEPATHDFGALQKVIAESQISTIRRSLADALRLSARLIGTSRNANREIYLISDFQRTLADDEHHRPQDSMTTIVPKGVQCFTVQLGSRPAYNVGIDSTEVLTKILEKNKPVVVYASVRNFSPAPINDYVVSVFLDGVRAAQKSVSLDPWGTSSTEFTVVPKNSGLIKGYVELESDAVDPDNKRYFTFFIPERINVLVVSSKGEDVQFPLLAIRSGKNDGDQSLIQVTRTTPEKFSTTNLSTTDIILSVDLSSYTSGDAARIKSFVGQGGGLVLFPGSAAGKDPAPNGLLQVLNIPPIEGITEFGSQPSGVFFRSVDLDHPLFSTMFELRQELNNLSLQAPELRRVLRRRAGKNGHTIIGLSNGTPFISEHNVGNGKVLMYSVAPDLSWSDFPLKALFAPLIYRSLIYAGTPGDQSPSFLTGDAPSLDLRNNPSSKLQGTSSGQLRVVAPDGVEEIVQASTSHGEPYVSLKPLGMAGFYEVRRDQEVMTVISSNIDPRESDGRKSTADEWQQFFGEFGIPPTMIRTMPATDQLQVAIEESRFGVELWKYCIGLALVLALIEMLIARDTHSITRQPA